MFKDDVVPGPTKREVRAIIVSRVTTGSGCKVLEIGTGTGALAEEFERLGCSVVSIEKSRDYILRGLTRIKNASVIHAEVPPLPIRGKFPVIIIGGTVNLVSTIRESLAHLQEGGVVVTVLVTLESLSSLVSAIHDLGVKAEIIQILMSKAILSKESRNTFLNPSYPTYIVFITGDRAKPLFPP